MNVLGVISPGLKVLFERVGKPEVVNRPDFFRFGGAGAVIACNHVGWADSLWMAYAVYPRQLRYMSKEELFGSTLSRLVLKHGGSVPIDRADPSPSSIKSAVDILQHGEIILIFPSGPHRAFTLRGWFGDQIAYAPFHDALSPDEFAHICPSYRGYGDIQSGGGISCR
jgi:1-acyl-sn-glycerol-3-phosphate acyltransferase